MKNANPPAPPASVQNFPIVGVGASAGGLNAFKSLLKAIPEDSGMAYVLVQHLSPSHESLLPEILQKVTRIPVHEITDDIKLAPNHIYVIPEDKILKSTDGVLKLSPRDKKILNLSVDVFFTSLAEVHKEFAAGVVLSGTGSDGTMGLKAIKEYAGICIAQDSESAAFDAMPQHAIDAGVVDFILPPEKIPAQLLLTYGSGDAQNEDGILRQILLLIRQRSGVDFTNYKPATVLRRITRRMVIHAQKNFSDYLSFLRSDKAEQDALFQDMLIPVTAFFRDAKVFETLCGTVFPALLARKNEGEPIRIWVAGCSTGEEAYSMAICLHETLGSNFSAQQIQIFASDISKTAINKARAGYYKKTDVEMLSAARLATYFTKSNRGYQVSKFIRDVCVFAPHNYLKDPPFSKMDVISCRNSLIYMDAYLQKKALSTFHYALTGTGYLVLGKSETASPATELFTPFKRQENIYNPKAAAGRYAHLPVKGRDEIPARQARIARTGEAPQTDVRKSAEMLLLSKFTPASVVVNEQMDVVHIHGNIAPYLESPQGKPSFNLLKMARAGLAFELRNALHKATATNSPVRKEDIPVKDAEGREGKDLLVCIEVVPLTDSLEPHFLILFTQREAAPVQAPLGKGGANASEIQKKNERLEEELAHSREDMRGITEDMEAFTEELQSSNEELQSSNEEMQSLNEELETSKEELQSSNEELMILNQELLDKQEQLSASLLYSDNIVSTIRGPLIVLDKSLRIKTANASFYSNFNTTEEATEGKYFYEIQNGQWGDAQMRTLLEKILPQKQQLSDFEIRPQFPELGERIMLLNARQIVNEKTAEQLILLAIEDVTQLSRAEKLLKQSEKQFRTFADSIQNLAWIANGDGWIYWYNQRWYDYTGTTLEEMEGWGWEKLHHPDHVKKITEFLKEAWKKDEAFELTFPLRRHDGVYRWFLTRAFPVKDAAGNIGRWIGTHTDITEQKSFAEELEKQVAERTAELQYSNEELRQTNTQLDQFNHIASHDLQEPLRKIQTFNTRLQAKHGAELSEDAKILLDKISGASSRMSRLIQDLLNYARLLSLEDVFTPTALNDTLKDILADFELLIQEKGAVVSSDSLPTISAIPLQMNQLFYNLLGNALKFTREDVPPVISISTHMLSQKEIEAHPALAPQSSYCEIIFKDNGIGFEQQYAQQIFVSFQRLHSQTAYPGTGIGLALVKRIVENHKGEISAESEEGAGAAFSVILPL